MTRLPVLVVRGRCRLRNPDSHPLPHPLPLICPIPHSQENRAAEMGAREIMIKDFSCGGGECDVRWGGIDGGRERGPSLAVLVVSGDEWGCMG